MLAFVLFAFVLSQPVKICIGFTGAQCAAAYRLEKCEWERAQAEEKPGTPVQLKGHSVLTVVPPYHGPFSMKECSERQRSIKASTQKWMRELRKQFPTQVLPIPPEHPEKTNKRT